MQEVPSANTFSPAGAAPGWPRAAFAETFIFVVVVVPVVRLGRGVVKCNKSNEITTFPS